MHCILKCQSEPMNVPLSVSSSKEMGNHMKWQIKKSSTSGEINPTTSEFDQPLLYRLSYEAVRQEGDRFREHIRDVERNNKEASKPVARDFLDLPDHSCKHMAVCSISLYHGNTETRKNLQQKFIFQISVLNPHGLTKRFSFH